jgi:hypothetical protein
MLLNEPTCGRPRHDDHLAFTKGRFPPEPAAAQVPSVKFYPLTSAAAGQHEQPLLGQEVGEKTAARVERGDRRVGAARRLARWLSERG